MSDHAALPYKAKRAIEVSQNSQHKTAVCLRERFSSFFCFCRSIFVLKNLELI